MTGRAPEHVREELTALLDGALDAARRSEVEAHLRACPECGAERERLGAAISALRALPAPPPPSPAFEARFFARLAREGDRPRGALARLAALRWRVVAPLAGAAAAAAMAAVAVVRHRADEAGLARNLELLDQLELVASLGDVDAADVEVVAHLRDLEEGRP
ncbi:MAG TPA: zf-HC2 domain-containing protein [Anaeromyxobacteraceae bacterium]|nr:zf-HC2 domain-containing protein [Anaeromyxobacteraceae bacterium]